METVWIRLGGVVTADKSTMKKILEGDTDALVKAIKKNGFRLNGETYIPAQGDLESDVDFDFVPDETLFIKTNNKKSGKTPASAKKIYNKEDFEFVDLGLPSGTLWAKSTAPGFYTFDEAKEQFPGILPEAIQFWELFEECDWQWLEKDEAPNGVAGYRVTGPNGNSIFLEANGCHFSKADVLDAGGGYYWSATALNSYFGRYLYLGSGGGGVYPGSYNDRCNGYSVRPAIKPKQPTR